MTDLSVIIPTFNRRGLLQEAIESAAAIRRLGPAVEIIVVDDCSTDDTWPWLQSQSADVVRAVRTPQNGGQSLARNLGLSQARGRYVLFLDSDDVLEPLAIHEGLREVGRSSPDIVVFGWGALFLGDPSASSRQDYPASTFTNVIDDVLRGLGPATSAALYRLEYVSDLRWDENLRKLDDWDWFCQAALRGGRIATVRMRAYWMRHHKGARVTSVATMLHNAREHHAILGKIEAHLEAQGELTEPRRKRLAQYYYRELRVLSLHDRAAFEAALQHIFELDPAFQPKDHERQCWMRLAARIFGTRATIVAHSGLKRLLGRVR